jgi:hypothetical protein
MSDEIATLLPLGFTAALSVISGADHYERVSKSFVPSRCVAFGHSSRHRLSFPGAALPTSGLGAARLSIAKSRCASARV